MCLICCEITSLGPLLWCAPTPTEACTAEPVHCFLHGSEQPALVTLSHHYFFAVTLLSKESLSNEFAILHPGSFEGRDHLWSPFLLFQWGVWGLFWVTVNSLAVRWFLQPCFLHNFKYHHIPFLAKPYIALFSLFPPPPPLNSYYKFGLKAARNGYAVAWMLSCLEISSTKEN